MEKVIEVLREAEKIVNEDIIKGAYSIKVNPGRGYIDGISVSNVLTIQADMSQDRVRWLNANTDIKVNETGIISGLLQSKKATVRVVLA